jgi:hypothetical protein
LGQGRINSNIVRRKGGDSGTEQRFGPASPPPGSLTVATSSTKSQNDSKANDSLLATLTDEMIEAVTTNTMATRAGPCTIVFLSPSSSSGPSPQETSNGKSDTLSPDNEETDGQNERATDTPSNNKHPFNTPNRMINVNAFFLQVFGSICNGGEW